MYHSISRFNSHLCVSPELFEDHCKSLAEAGWRGISLAEAEDYFVNKRRLPAKVCLFTFDDGYLDNYVHAEPLLRRYGHHGLMFPVAECLLHDNLLRPNSEDLGRDPERAKELPDMDKRAPIAKAGIPVHGIDFCSWREVKHMHHHGNMASAPHSLRHDRVVRSLEYNVLFRPGGRRGFFSTPPYTILWGLPRFDLGHALNDRAYTLNPEVFDVVKQMVPQAWQAAQKFLDSEENRKAIQAAVAKLPSLGVRETEAQYRERIFQELVRCRELFSEQLGSLPLSFCWPWGSNNSVAIEEGRRAGFKVFFTTRRGLNRPGTQNVHRIPVRGGNGQELLHQVSHCSSSLREVMRMIAIVYNRRFSKK